MVSSSPRSPSQSASVNVAPEWVQAGHIARAHGVHGAVRVLLDVSLKDLIEPPQTLRVRRRNRSEAETVSVLEWREIHRALLVSFTPALTREEAMAFAGAEIFIPQHCLAPPLPGEYYFFELIGAELVDEGGVQLGVIDELLDNQGQALLALTDTAGRAQLLPLVPAFCKHYDRDARRLTVTVPEDLWE